MSAMLPDTRAMSVPEAAASWCALGWQSVPVGPDKRPLAKWRNARPETPAQTLARFSGLTRGAGLAIALPADVVVLDVDNRPAHGWDGETILAALVARFTLPTAPLVKTPSGGRHLWLALPEGAQVRNSTSQGGPLEIDGVDVRTKGGLIIVPPSQRQAGAYSWLYWQASLPVAPPQLVAALQPKRQSPPAAPPRTLPGGGLSPYAEAVVRLELDSVAGCQRGGRNTALFKASARLAGLHAGGALPDVRARLEDAASRAGLIRDDGLSSVRATIKSGWTRGLQTPRSLSKGGR